MADLLRILPTPRRLVPLSRDILFAHLCVSHSATGNLDASLRDKLPREADLARLSWSALVLALRAPTANGVAKRLRDSTHVGAAAGPTLADIEGYGAAEAIARQMVADLRGWSEGRIAWSEVQRSVLFYGAPGTGKSHLALAMSNSAGVSLVRGSFAQWQSRGHLGDMLAAMRASFAQAAQQRPAILVIDEIDAVGDRANKDQHNARYQLQVTNGFLEEMDRLKHMEGVLVVGTCNYPEKIDAAVLRPGRFDVKVEVPLPGPKALARMVRDGFANPLSDSDIERLTRAAAGSSAADVDGALRQARSVARAEGREITVGDLLCALAPDPEDENPARDHRVAVHECGHAIVAVALGVGKVKRLTYTGQGGEAWVRLSIGEGRLEEVEAELTYHLAGRAAERLILGNVTAGAGGPAHSDLARATQLAVRIDTQLGLGAEGLAWQDLSTGAYLRSPENAMRIRARLEAAEIRGMQVLQAERDLLLGRRFKFFHCTGVKGAKAGALNIALAQTRSDATHIVTIDADYIVAPEFLAEAANALQRTSADYVQLPQAYRRPADVAKGLDIELEEYFRSDASMADDAEAVLLTGTLCVISKTALMAVEGWSGRTTTEDAELGVRLCQAGFTGRYIPKIIGKGLLPLTLKDLSQQRYRWTSGNFRTLALHLPALMTHKRALRRGQVIAIVAQLGTWLNFSLIPTACLLSVSLTQPSSSAVITLASLSIILTLADIVTRFIARSCAILPKRDWGMSAVAARLALAPSAARATVDACLPGRQHFTATRKSASRAGANDLPFDHIVTFALAVLALSGLSGASTLHVISLVSLTLPLPAGLWVAAELARYRRTIQQTPVEGVPA